VDHHSTLAYLTRIGMPTDLRPPSLDLLRELHIRHLWSVPFENLSIHLDEPINLDEDVLFDKIISRRRGGFCYELNGSFAALLEALGFRVSRHAARVFQEDGGLGIPFDHLALIVDLDEEWLVDVGFGRHSSYPLGLNRPDAQDDPGGKFLILDAPGSDVDVIRDGAPQYRMERRARELEEFRIGAWWHQTSPASHFTQSLTCSLPLPDGRVTVSGNRMIKTIGDDRTETVLPDDAAILDAYRTIFGFELDRVPVIRSTP
jgi:N-hydroxyarylamine O-acetyltransferase